MFLSRLRLRDFRNFTEQVLELPPQGVAIIGDNGHGKTNLLEAIYYLEIFRSFRNAPDEQLVRFGADVFRIEGRVEGGTQSVRDIAAAFDRRGKRKKVTLGAAEPPRLSDIIGGVGAIIFSPSDVGLVSGGPGARRRFLDIVLSLAVPGYLNTLQRFRHVLAQRNQLLRQGAAPALVEAWNPGLVTYGSRVISERARWIAEHADGFARQYARIAGGPAAAMSYEPSVDLTGDLSRGAVPLQTELEEAFATALQRAAEREQRRAMTLVGPHRDDVRIAAESGSAGEWVDLRVFGSGGQQRTAAVALRMVEADTIRATRERAPILLLDDVFAELDPGRSRRILEWVGQEEVGQVILTAPKPTDFEFRGDSLPCWQIQSGEIRPL